MCIFLVLGRLASWTLISDDHRLLLTSAGWEAFLVNSSMDSLGEHYMERTTFYKGSRTCITWCRISVGPGMQANVAWKWKAGEHSPLRFPVASCPKPRLD